MYTKGFLLFISYACIIPYARTGIVSPCIEEYKDHCVNEDIATLSTMPASSIDSCLESCTFDRGLSKCKAIVFVEPSDSYKPGDGICKLYTSSQKSNLVASKHATYLEVSDSCPKTDHYGPKYDYSYGDSMPHYQPPPKYQPSYQPMPSYAPKSYAPPPQYAPAPVYKPQPTYYAPAPAPVYKPTYYAPQPPPYAPQPYAPQPYVPHYAPQPYMPQPQPYMPQPQPYVPQPQPYMPQPQPYMPQPYQPYKPKPYAADP